MNGPPFGWSVVSDDAPRVVDQQEDLQPDGPLQRVDVALLAIAERHDAAAGVAFDVAADPLARARERRVR